MLSKCIILFLATLPLIIIANEVSEYFNSYGFKFGKEITERKKLKFRLTQQVFGFIFVLSTFVMIMTVIFGTYIHIFL